MKNMFKKSGYLVSFVVLLWSGVAFSQQAEVVWVEASDDKNNIFYGFFDKGEWHKKIEPLYSSDNGLTAATLVTNAKNQKTLLWTEIITLGSVLMAKDSLVSNVSVDRGEVQLWSKERLFSEFGFQNYSPTAVTDKYGVTWVFWSANIAAGELSDIYMIKTNSTGWSKPEMVNEKNEVPDSTPVALFDKDGSVVVEWSSYDFDVGSYVTKSKNYVTKNQAEETLLAMFGRYFDNIFEKEDVAIDGIEWPLFVPKNQRTIVHFPNNRKRRSQLMTVAEPILAK